MEAVAADIVEAVAAIEREAEVTVGALVRLPGPCAAVVKSELVRSERLAGNHIYEGERAIAELGLIGECAKFDTTARQEICSYVVEGCAFLYSALQGAINVNPDPIGFRGLSRIDSNNVMVPGCRIGQEQDRLIESSRGANEQADNGAYFDY